MKKGFSIVLAVLLALLSGLNGWLAYQRAGDVIDQGLFYLLAGGPLLISLVLILLLVIPLFRKKRPARGYLAIVLCVMALLTTSTLAYAGKIDLPRQETLPDFSNMTMTDVQQWADDHHITLNTSNENSDTIEQYHIMSQSPASGSLLKNIHELSVMVSDGPNYGKTILLANMTGWTLDEVLDVIQTNFLNNVTINFENSTEVPYTVLSQSASGELRRNSPITFVFAYNTAALTPQTMIDMSNMSVFDATLWLKRNGIPYTASYEFSDTVERGHVISTSAAKGEQVSVSSNVGIVISRGKKIIAPDLTQMSVKEVTVWAVENNLRLSFSENYDDKVPEDAIISASCKAGDELEETSTVRIVTSLGPLRMPDVSSLAQFTTWADTYGVKYTTSEEYSDTVARGAAISYSYKPGDIIPNGATVSIVVSLGASVTVPNFYGSSYSSAQSSASAQGLYTDYVYGGYRDEAAGTVVAQSIAAGTVVASGTTVTLTLSSGPAKSYTLYFSSAQLGNSYDETVSSLSSYFEANYPGVYFEFASRASSSLRSGMIAPDNPTQPGMTVTQGHTYTIYVVR